MPEAPKIFRQSALVLDKYVQSVVLIVCVIIMSVIICYSIAFLVSSFGETEGFEYKLVGVIFRHGDRTPDNHDHEVFPTSPYSELAFYPYGYGQLTNRGKQRAYELGLHIRDKYDKFLGDIYHPHAVFAQSSYYDRSKMSLQMVMAAIFPPAAVQMWNSTLNWQPVVMNYAPRYRDNLLAIINCSNFVEELYSVLKLPEVEEELEKLSDLRKDLSEWTGVPMNNLLDLGYLYHGLTALQSMGLKLPEWTSGIFPDGILSDVTVMGYRFISSTPRMKTLVGGRILKNFIDIMRAVMKGDGESKRKMILLSGHDLNVSSLLSIIGYKPHVPEYSSAVFVELLANGGNYYISVQYYLGIPPKTIPIKIPGCGEVCPFNKFIELFGGVLPTEEDLVC